MYVGYYTHACAGGPHRRARGEPQGHVRRLQEARRVAEITKQRACKLLGCIIIIIIIIIIISSSNCISIISSSITVLTSSSLRIRTFTGSGIRIRK